MTVVPEYVAWDIADTTDVVHEHWCWCRCHDEYDPGCPSWCSWCDEDNDVKEPASNEVEWDFEAGSPYWWDSVGLMTISEIARYAPLK